MIDAVGNTCKDISLIEIVAHMEKSLSFQFGINWTRIGGVIND